MRPPVPPSVRLLLAATAVALASGPTTAPAQEAAVVRGTVRGSLGERQIPLPHAWVSVDRDGSGSGTAVSDDAGRYEIRGVEPGARQIRVERLGYRPHRIEVVVPAGAIVEVDLELEGEPVLVRGILIRADRGRPVRGLEDAAGTDLVDVALRTLELTPGAAESGFAAARALAGGEPGSDAATLLVRGGDPDPKQVLLDGVPVHAPFHLGGLLEAVDPSLLARVEDHVGAAPASVPGGLSRVTELHTRAPAADGPAARAAVDAVSSRARFETPLGEAAGALLSARALHGLGARVLDGGPLPYGYGEALLRLEAVPAEGHRLGMTGFWNRESVRLELPTTAPGGAPLAVERAGEEARWGNRALSLRYEGRRGEGRLGAVVAGSSYEAVLPLGRSRPAWARGRTDRIRLGVDAGREVGAWSLDLGLGAEGIRHESSARVLLEEEERSVEHSTEGTVAGGYVEALRPLAPDVTLRAGLRADHFAGGGGLRLSPRASLTWLLTQTAVVRVAAGRHYHFVQPTELEAQVVLDDPGATRAGQALFPVAGATHLVVSVDQALTPEVHLGLEGHVKAFDGLPDPEGDRLRASGLDVRIRRVGETSRAWLGYSLAWFWDPDPAGDSASAATRPFRGRHLLTTGLDGHLTEVLRGSVHLSYGDGLPLSSVPLFGDDAAATPDALPVTEEPTRGTARNDPVAPGLDGFLRVDLEISAGIDGSLAGREARFRPYLRVVNALDRRDALFFYFEPWRSPDARAVGERSVLPVLGLEVTF